MLTRRWLNLARRLAVVVGLYIILRMLFFFHNSALFRQATVGQVGKAFLLGLRFDLSAIVTINALFILLMLSPRRSAPGRTYEWCVKSVYVVLNVPFLIINAVDLEFVQFTRRRATLELLGKAGDEGVRFVALALYYWPVSVLSLFLVGGLFVFYGRLSSRSDRAAYRINPSAWATSLVAAAALSVLSIRGGLQLKPLNPADAMIMRDGALAQLALNSSFTVLRSLDKPTLTRQRWFPDREASLRRLRPLVDGDQLVAGEGVSDNVVILILESFATEYWGAGNGGSRYTPFLDSLAGQSLFFPNNYANGMSSIEVMPSVLAGLPSLMDEAFIQSAFQGDELVGLGTLLGRKGYTSSFFHGGRNGTMRFDTFMHMAGIQHYFGLNEYPDKADYDGNWGVYDLPFLQFVARKLGEQNPPFAAAVFTLSSHHPYLIEDKYRGWFRKGTLEIHESIGYTDYALAQFFAAARRQPWYQNTLFIITADHTQKLETPEYSNALGQFRVPLLMFHPRRKLPQVDTNRITQHVDILPSVLDYLQIEPERRLLFGRSVFRSGEGRAFLYLAGQYWLVRGRRVLSFVPGRASQLFDLDQKPSLQMTFQGEPDRLREMETEAKALVQYFNNGMLDNNLYDSLERTNGSAQAQGRRK